MPGKSAFIGRHPQFSWLRRHGFAVRLPLCFLSVFPATVIVRFMPEANHMIWAANGVLLAFLILAPRRRWPAYLIAGLIAQTAGSVVFTTQWQMNLALTAMNITEAFIAALLLRRASTAPPRFTDRAYLLRFICYGVLAGPLAMGLLYAPIAARWQHAAPLPALIEWLVADGLGICLATPAWVAILRIRSRDMIGFGKHWIYLLPVVAVSLATFSQNRIPLQFLLFPLLILVLLRLGLGWASVALLFVAWVGSWFTVHGQGPFVSSNYFSPLEPTIVVQAYIASVMFMLYAVSVVLESRYATERRLRKIVVLHTLVTENSRDVIVLADFNGRPRYISSAVFSLTGWKPEETMHRGFTEVAHPDDLPRIEALIRKLRTGAESATIEYRIRLRTEGYIWVEGSFRSIRDPESGDCSGILQMVRDISGRKIAEQKLQEAYRAVETLAITDALTGLANRRRFDQCLMTEWRRGLRDHNPLAMLLIDVDLFKSYNDTYGHVRGDSCLKQIAEAAQDVVARPGDLVARFGGEEFAVILPNTGNEGAMRIADEICEGLRRRNLAHSANPLGFLTISVGCAAIVPSFGEHAVNLVEAADKALYVAKRNGRNQVCLGNATHAAADGLPVAAISQPAIAKSA